MLPRPIAELFASVPLAAPLDAALAATRVSGLQFDSRLVQPGDLFWAFIGANFDGRVYAPQALAAGAVAIVSEHPAPGDFTGPWIHVQHARRSLALASRAFFHDPTSSRVALFGVTGTNGKTTTAYILASILEAAAFLTALFGTIEYRIGSEKLDSVNTTPESLELYRHMARLEAMAPEPGAALAVAMEASSHALALGRIWGLTFRGVVWTNLTRDHLDFHGDMESYKQAKFELFRGQDAPPPAFAAINADDPVAQEIPLASETQAWTYALHADAQVHARDIDSTFAGARFILEYPGGSFPVETGLLGDINVLNILGAAAVTLRAGLPPAAVARGIANCGSVPGRFEPVDQGQPFYVVADYAHTDDALRNVIRVARALNPKRLITLFGCGGDRDRAKRPLMGSAAASLSDYVVLTSDNPRTEDPIAILNDALVGVRRHDTPHIVEPDRAKAIRKALEQASPGDFVLLAGKGHETYQILGKTKYPFDDREVARQALAALGYSREALRS
jgi:UDP-N-acetylmuramoyl-L-alanyl-D-glutamate--2,6-diaminopimelate ligase